MILNAEDFSGQYLGTVPVVYPAKNINTEALQVTPENIGSLSVELHTDLRYANSGQPYIAFRAQRGTGEDAEDPFEVTLVAGDWMVVLWDELHVFKNFEFTNTFAFTTPVTEKTLAWEPGDGPPEQPMEFVRGDLSQQDPRSR